MIARRLSVLAVLALGLAGSGCGPAHRVVWLPDSSGFVYSPNGPKGTGDAALIHYDLKQKTARGLKYVPSQSMIMPGISPDRKQIALVRAQKNRNQRVTAQVILMDLDTGSIHESSPGTLGVLKGETERVPSCVLALTEWSPKRDHLLISSVPPLFDDDDSGIADLVAYDLKTDTLMPLRGLASTFFDRPLNGSIAGDGSGFLAFSVEEWKKSQKGESEDAKITYAALLKTLVFVELERPSPPIQNVGRDARRLDSGPRGPWLRSSWCMVVQTGFQSPGLLGRPGRRPAALSWRCPDRLRSTQSDFGRTLESLMTSTAGNARKSRCPGNWLTAKSSSRASTWARGNGRIQQLRSRARRESISGCRKNAPGGRSSSRRFGLFWLQHRTAENWRSGMGSTPTTSAFW